MVCSNKISWQQVGDEVLILDHETMLGHRLNRVATIIWREALAGASDVEVAGRVAGRFTASDPIEISARTIGMLSRFRKLGFLL